jgi:RND family efflux transporter MFP subunit
MNRLATWFLLAAALAASAGCGHKPGKKPRPAEIERVPRLETITPKLQPEFLVKREYTATVEAMERARIMPQVRGVVRTLREAGQHVRGPNTPFPAPTAAGVVGLLNGSPLLGVAMLADELEADVLARLDIPEVLAERDNKKALLELALKLQKQSEKALTVAGAEVEEVEAQQQRYRAEVKAARIHLERMTRLVKTQTVQPQQRDEAELKHESSLAELAAAGARLTTRKARLDAAKADVEAAQSRVGAARSSLQEVETRVGFGTIRAPFDGNITLRQGNVGETTTDLNKPLLTVMKVDVMRVVLDVPERDVPFLQAEKDPGGGNDVTLTVPALKRKGLKWEFLGKVKLTARALDVSTRTMRVEVWLRNGQGLLLPQMTGTATVTLEGRKNVITVPSSAVVREGEKASVYCVVEDRSNPSRGVVRHLDVQVGADDGQVVEIRSGLTGRERVITKGNGVVREGDFAIAVPAK